MIGQAPHPSSLLASCSKAVRVSSCQQQLRPVSVQGSLYKDLQSAACLATSTAHGLVDSLAFKHACWLQSRGTQCLARGQPHADTSAQSQELFDDHEGCSEEPPYGSDRKPEEMYHIIEHFVLGRRRLELFGEDHNVRPGWVTVGLSLSASNFSPQVRIQQPSWSCCLHAWRLVSDLALWTQPKWFSG